MNIKLKYYIICEDIWRERKKNVRLYICINISQSAIYEALLLLFAFIFLVSLGVLHKVVKFFNWIFDDTSGTFIV